MSGRFGERPTGLERFLGLHKVRETEAGSIEEFANLLKKHAKPADYYFHVLQSYEPLHYIPNAPYVEIEAQPTGILGEGFEWVFNLSGRRPEVISYRESKELDQQAATDTYNRHQRLAEEAKKRKEAAEQALHQRVAQSGVLENIANFLGAMEAKVRRLSDIREPGVFTDYPAAKELEELRDAIRNDEDIHAVNRAERNLPAYQTSQARAVELRDIAAKLGINVVVHNKFGEERIIEEAMERAGGVAPWQKPEPRRTTKHRKPTE